MVYIKYKCRQPNNRWWWYENPHIVCEASCTWPHGAVNVYRITRRHLSKKQVQIILNSSLRIHLGNYHNWRKCGAVHFLCNNCKTNVKREPASTVRQALTCVKYFQKAWGLRHWKSVLWDSFIPLACAECDDSLPFSRTSSISLWYIPLPSTLFHQLVFHPSSLHLAIYFLVYLSALLLPNSYIIFFWELYFLTFSVHAQTNVIYFCLLSLLQRHFNHCINFFIG